MALLVVEVFDAGWKTTTQHKLCSNGVAMPLLRTVSPCNISTPPIFAHANPIMERQNDMQVKIINRSPFPLPQYETTGSAGLDLRAHTETSIALGPLERVLVPTGLFIELPIGYEAQVRPRSGLAIKKGLGLVNSPGTIDSDYRGEIKIILVNLSNETQTVEPGERIAQMVVAKYERIDWTEVVALSETVRGAGGFGSTGT